MTIGALILASYLLGSIPFGYLIGRAKGVDIRSVGSGNIGATNVHRILGKTAGMLVFLLDVLKGLIPAFLLYYLYGYQLLAFSAGFAAVVGHCLSPFLGFRGGKGIATGLGMLFGSTPVVALLAFAMFFVMMFITRYVSLSCIVAALSVVPLGLAFDDPLPMVAMYLFVALFVVFRHKANIARLKSGTEPKFSLKGSGEGDKPSRSLGMSVALGALIILTVSLIALSASIQLNIP
jgi:acyl phosphate:glycerol-3-phosphate acyltransferase